MKVYEEKISTTKYQALTKLSCDLCKRETTKSNGKWAEEDFETSEVAIILRTGYNCPDGGNGTEITIDLCPNCFRDKLIPWIKSQGGEPSETEWDW